MKLVIQRVSEAEVVVDKQKIVTDNITESGQYVLRMIISYFDENGKKKNIKKETILNIQGKV